MASKRAEYTKLTITENWLLDELIQASQQDLHVTIRESKTRRDFLWLWSPMPLEKEPKVWDVKSLMVSKPGGTMDSIELTKVQISSTRIYITGSLLSNIPGNDEPIRFELDCTFVGASDVLYEGKWSVSGESSVVILSNDTSSNWWLTPLPFLDSSMTKGDPVWYKGQQWEFVKWNGGRGQVTLHKQVAPNDNHRWPSTASSERIRNAPFWSTTMSKMWPVLLLKLADSISPPILPPKMTDLPR